MRKAPGLEPKPEGATRLRGAALAFFAGTGLGLAKNPNMTAVLTGGQKKSGPTGRFSNALGGGDQALSMTFFTASFALPADSCAWPLAFCIAPSASVLVLPTAEPTFCLTEPATWLATPLILSVVLLMMFSGVVTAARLLPLPAINPAGLRTVPEGGENFAVPCPWPVFAQGTEPNAAFRRFRLAFNMARQQRPAGGYVMGRGILLWLLGVPIPIILLLAFLKH